MATNTKKQYTSSSSSSNAKKRPAPRTDNLLEALRDIGGDSFDSLKRDVFEGIPRDIKNEFLGWDRPKPKVSGDLMPGQTLKIEQALVEEREENKILRAKLGQEQRMRQEEHSFMARKGQELKVELHALTSEVVQLAKTTQGLSKQVEIAAEQGPANPGIYHIVFFEKLRSFIASFRKKVQNASLWMESYNSRATKKKSYWGQVAKSGAKRLLSPEDYNQRSAG